ncbi:MAG: hypothetical protein Q4F05_14880 [bacterium]|nr:hypothetical protein [bacterium]
MKIRHRRIGIVWVLIMSLWMTGCSRSNAPDNAHDILSMAYSNMSSLSSYSAVTTFHLSMEYTETTKQIHIVSNITGVNEPMEIMMEHKLDGETDFTYDYIYEKEDEEYRTSYAMGKWSKPEKISKELVESLNSPVLFGVYFIDINSFEIVKKDKESIVLEGKIGKEHLDSALKESGALRQFSLTSLTKEVMEALPEIKVRAWINQETVTISKVELDMKETLQALIPALIGRNSVASAKVAECTMVLDQIKQNEVTPVNIPGEIKKSLQEAIA